MTLLAYAVRRGLEHYSTASSLVKRDAQGDDFAAAFMNLGGAVIIITFLLFVAALVAVDYSVSSVITTLAMIETPTSAITVTPASDDDITLTGGDEAKEGLLETGPNITLVAQKPITAKIRGTVRHLRSQAGRLAPWRGYMNYVLYSFLFGSVASVLELLLPNVPGIWVLISAATGALLVKVHAAWTHKVVSMPSQLRFWQRVTSVSDWKALALPAAIQASSTYISLYILQGYAYLVGLDSIQHEDMTDDQAWVVAIKALSLFGIAIACGLFFCLPAMATLIRVESSVLPEDQETIVPFDRTFDGKVEPKIHGGSGVVGFVHAWKSFNWEARRRVIKLYFKSLAIGAAMGFIFAHVVLLEVWAFMGTAFFAKMAEAQRNGVY